MLKSVALKTEFKNISVKFVSRGYVFGDADIVTKGKSYAFTLKSATAGATAFRMRSKNYLD